MRIFVAGATGAVGQHLVPRLTAAGHQVTGTTRSKAKAAALQSYIGWNSERTGGMIKTEEDPADPHPPATATESLAAIEHVDRAVAAHGGIVLRYGSFYGPGASELMLAAVRKRRIPIVGSGAGVWSFIEITDAAAAAAAAVTEGSPGLYNIVDDDPAPVSVWLPYLAECLHAKPPMHVPAWLGRIAGGEFTVIQMTQARGASNAKARRELGWEPKYTSWRDGFRDWAGLAKDGAP